MSRIHTVLASVAPFALAACILPTNAAAQDWCSDAARRFCGIGSFNYSGTYTGTLTLRSQLSTQDYSRTTEYVVTVADGRATCSGASRWTDGGQSINGESGVKVRLDNLLAGRSSGTYSLEASCLDWVLEAEYISVDGQTTDDYGNLAGQLTIPHGETDPDNGVSGSVTMTWKLTSNPQVISRPGGPYTVERGARLALDGSASEGVRLTYSWTIEPADCPSELGLKQAQLDGVRPELSVPCSLNAQLTVANGSQSHSALATITVAARAWQTLFEHVAEEGVLERTQPTIRRVSASGQPAEFEGAFVGGENVSAYDPSADARETLHPRRQDGTWEDRGYTLARIEDGPFAGVWYVASYDIEVSRRTLINRYLLPDGPALRAGSFYAENVKRKTDIVAYLEAVRAHEGMYSAAGEPGHSGLIQRALRGNDPAPKVEALMDRDRLALRRRIDELLTATDVALCKAGDDPLPAIWSGRVAFPYDDSSGWEIVHIAVGGKDYYGGRATCG